jgi:hypothetical protein
MGKFLLKTALYFSLLAAIALLYLLLIYLKPQLVDDFYYRFTTPKASSLILGSSRSAQGIKPSVINKRICTEENKIINHSFAIGPSSIGPNYYKEVTQKLKDSNTNGVFIISVDPWTLSTSIKNINDDSTQFFEVRKELFVGNLKSSSTNPNMDYLYTYWNNKFSPFGMLFKQAINYKNMLILHEDGWLEMDIDMTPAVVEHRIQSSTIEYSSKEDKLSETRFFFLEKIISLLLKHGDVYLVRMPVSLPMAELEEMRFPEFDNKIQNISNKYQLKYINFIGVSGDFKTTDTHHLFKDEAERFTNLLCDSIAAKKKFY